MALKSVRFVKHSGAYNAGEVAGFEPEVAEDLVRKGIAVAADGGEESPASGDDATSLADLSKAQLIERGAGLGLELGEHLTKAQMVEAIEEKSAPLAELNKAQLIARGTSLGLELSEHSTKAELVEAIEAKMAESPK